MAIGLGRTDKEILTMLDNLKKSNTDPTGSSVGLLTRKLSWNFAKPFINPKYHNDPVEEKKWNQRCVRDEWVLKIEMKNLLDKSFHAWCDGDYLEVWQCCNVYIAYFWLLGESYRDQAREAFELFSLFDTDNGLNFLNFCAQFCGIETRHLIGRYKKNED